MVGASLCWCWGVPPGPKWQQLPSGADEFARAVYVATGHEFTRHLVNTVFKIFDVDHDDKLSYKEFIGIMQDRLLRRSRVRARGAV